MAKTTKQEAKRLNKEDLFKDFLYNAYEALWQVELWFNAAGLRDNYFGITGNEDCASFEDARAHEARTNTVRSSLAWQALSALYDYAVVGIAEDDATYQVVLDGAAVLTLVSSEESRPSEEWSRIVWLGDGRNALDEGSDVLMEKLAFLADVDVRTVRNAISAGELVAFKVTDGLQPGIHIDNASARSWLQGRRGFTPTVFRAETAEAIGDVRSPAEFGAFLVTRREQLGLEAGEGKLLPMVPGVNAKGLAAVEAGVFELPLNAVNPLADFYQLDRKAFLKCVMRVFFSDYYATILESSNA